MINKGTEMSASHTLVTPFQQQIANNILFYKFSYYCPAT